NICRAADTAICDLLSLQRLDVRNLRFGVQPVYRAIESNEKETERSATKNRSKSGPADRAEIYIAADQCSKRHRRVHQDEIDVQSLFPIESPILRSVKGHVRNTLCRHGNLDASRLAVPRQQECSQKPDKNPHLSCHTLHWSRLWSKI